MIKEYLKNSFEELTKVTWPTKNQAVRLTIIVLIFCVATALFLGAMDYIFNRGYNYLLSIAPPNAPAVVDFSDPNGLPAGIDITTESSPDLNITVDGAETSPIDAAPADGTADSSADSTADGQ
ncbi:MAG: preprotein translocase subunit SecE [Candidatus Peregrinibacteria bacterium]